MKQFRIRWVLMEYYLVSYRKKSVSRDLRLFWYIQICCFCDDIMASFCSWWLHLTRWWCQPIWCTCFVWYTIFWHFSIKNNVRFYCSSYFIPHTTCDFDLFPFEFIYLTIQRWQGEVDGDNIVMLYIHTAMVNNILVVFASNLYGNKLIIIGFSHSLLIPC